MGREAMTLTPDQQAVLEVLKNMDLFTDPQLRDALAKYSRTDVAAAIRSYFVKVLAK